MQNKEKFSLNSYSGHDSRSIEPYIGPRPFGRSAEDQQRFFGRDAETNEIVALVSSHRIVLIYAQSGAGKTSIFNAQVTPSLENYGFEVLPTARVQLTSATSSEISPKNSNDNISSQIENSYIFNALQSLLSGVNPVPPESISDLALFEFLDKYVPIQRDEDGEVRPQVLIFDQLEELFTFYPKNWIEQQGGFFQQVADSLENNPFLRVILVIREDFLAHLDPYRKMLPEKLRVSFRLERLRRNQATNAIKRPLIRVIENVSEEERINIDSEIDALVNELLKINVETPGGGYTREVEGEFVEPIQLQVVCRRWWREREETSKRQGNKKTTLEDIGSVDRALEDFYEDAIIRASKQTRVSEEDIRIWCQEKLITSSGTRNVVHRGPTKTAGIDNSVVEWLEREYLIRKEARAGAFWYELSHDRLIKSILSSNARWKTTRKRIGKLF